LKEGSIFLKNGELYRQQAFKVTVVDTTAAGDTFTGYFAAGLCAELENSEMLRRASAASAITVSRKGAASSVPTWEEVDEQIDSMQLSLVDSKKKREEIEKKQVFFRFPVFGAISGIWMITAC